MKAGPRRTCLGCRQARPKGALVRPVVSRFGEMRTLMSALLLKGDLHLGGVTLSARTMIISSAGINIGLQSMIFGDIYPWGQLMAASILISVPVVVVYGYAQRFLVEGLTVGAVKG